MATPMMTPGMTPGGGMGSGAASVQRLPPEVNRILYVRNLPFNISAEELYKIFGDYGAIRQIRTCALLCLEQLPRRVPRIIARLCRCHHLIRNVLLLKISPNLQIA
jgi:RNA recognition motif-containing protein